MTEPLPQSPDDPSSGIARSLERLALSLRYAIAPAFALAPIVLLMAWPDPRPILLILVGALGAVAAWVVAEACAGLAVLLRIQARRITTEDRLELRLTEGFERIAAAIEASARSATVAVSSPSDQKHRLLAEIRQAIRAGAWSEADDLIRENSAAHPEDAAAVEAELSRAREHAGRDLLEKVDAARQANDPDRVLELRDSLRHILAHDALKSLDHDLARWCMALIQRRLRTGKMRADVAVLAQRVALSLDDTPEGASLRASLPTLRRAAGLCARCGQPYTGIADACPMCLGAAAAAAAAVIAPAPAAVDRPADPADADQNGVPNS
jgi:hypothetical protein